MKRLLLAGVAVMVLLTGCASGRLDSSTGFQSLLVRKPNPYMPNVFVEDDSVLIVDQEPIRIKLNQKRNPVIVFALDASQDYVFDEKPIAIEPVGRSARLLNLSCPAPGSGSGQKTLVCTYQELTEAGKYTYTLRVRNVKTGKVIVSDPTIVNDF